MATITEYVIKDQQLLFNMLELIATLRSGDYTQIMGHLCGEGNKRCVVGVMCELAKHVGKWSDTMSDDMRYFDHQLELPDNSNSYMQAPIEVYSHFGLKFATHYDIEYPAVYYLGEMCSIVYLNDKINLPFSNLADLLEQTYVRGIEIDDDEDFDENRSQTVVAATTV